MHISSEQAGSPTRRRELRPGGVWVKIAVEDFEPPPICTRCGSPASHTTMLAIGTRGVLALIGRCFIGGKVLELYLPLCRGCYLRLNWLRAVAIVSLGVAIAPFPFIEFRQTMLWWHAALVSLGLGHGIALLPALTVVNSLAKAPKLRRFDPRRGTVELWAANGEFLSALDAEPPE